MASSPNSRGGHSHRRRSHSCDRGQEAVKGSRAVFGVGQAVKDNFQTRYQRSRCLRFARVRIAHSVVKCVRSNGQGPICGAVKQQKRWFDDSAYGGDHPLKLQLDNAHNISFLVALQSVCPYQVLKVY